MPNLSTSDGSHGCAILPVSSMQGSQLVRPRECRAPLPTLFRMVPLLMTLAVGPTVAVAQGGDNEQGKGNDPTGAWIVTDTVTDTSPGSDGLPTVLLLFTRTEPHQGTCEAAFPTGSSLVLRMAYGKRRVRERLPRRSFHYFTIATIVYSPYLKWMRTFAWMHRAISMTPSTSSLKPCRMDRSTT